MTSAFQDLNAQIGAYETYDDELYGVKAFFGFSLLRQDAKRTAEVRNATRAGCRRSRTRCPTRRIKTVREDIPVVIADVLADFGQCRGTNTATILPNDNDHARRYGRIIVMRRNIMVDSVITESARAAWRAASPPAYAADFDPEETSSARCGTSWVTTSASDRDRSGRPLAQALHEDADTFEEMKADLVSLFLGKELRARGYYTDQALHGLYASGAAHPAQEPTPLRRGLRRDAADAVQLVAGARVARDRPGVAPAPHPLRPRHEAVGSLLEQVMAVQSAGDPEKAKAFITRWTTWDARHDAIAAAMRATETSRFRLVRYAALGE